MPPDPVGFAGELIRDLLVFGQRVDVWFRPESAEIDRRAYAGLGALADADALRALMTLPAGLAVPMMDLHPLDRLVLEGLPDGVVAISDGTITRQARQPVEVTGLVKHAASWEDIRAVSLLRTHAPRMVLASEPLARRVLREADPDIGVAVRADAGVIPKRAAGRRWLKPSWQRWLLAERVFAAWSVSV